MIVHECEQMSDEWFSLRKGLPTASNFDRIITAKTHKIAAASEAYIHELVGEKLCLTPPAEKPTNGAMRHGIAFEDEARRWLEMELRADLKQVGFITDNEQKFGCSPDFLTVNGGGEIKCPQPGTHVRWVLEGGLPPEHAAQVHGGMVVTGLSHWLFCSYCPGFEPLLVHVTPDEFTAKLRKALDEFHARYSEILAKFTRRAA